MNHSPQFSPARLAIWLAVLAFGGAGATASAQTIIDGDVLPGILNNKVFTGAHLDATGADIPNVRVFGYAFQTDPLDPYFTQDPGFNAPAGNLPAATAFAFNIQSGLTYWNGAGPVTFSATPHAEKFLFTLGAASRTITGTTAAQSGFLIGNVAANGALHKHLNAFLQGSDMTTTPTNGVYMNRVTLTDSGAGIADSDPIYLLYDNGPDIATLDRAKFRVRNDNAPGTQLAGTLTNMIGLSTLPGETNYAAGGQVTITGTNGGYRSAINPLASPQGIGSAVLNHIGPEGRTLVMLWLNGSNSDINSLIGSLDGQPGYDIAGATVGNTDPLYADIHRLQASYPGFTALAAFDSTTANGAFTWDFSGATLRDANGGITSFNVTVDRIAAVPEPTLLSLLGISCVLGLRRLR